MEGRLGKYDLLERLATGGMAELFLARASQQHGFEKTVVLKRILPAFAEQEDFIRMFMAEAQLAASLHHPNIAQVFDFGEERGTFYFTMEYIAGRNLRQLLAAARKESASLPLGCALHIIVGVAAGLHHAHEHRDADNEPLQIVHRDVSPSNVIVTYEGNVKLVDFGIAKVAALGPATLSGSLKGKIAYMSPEQCRGELVDRRSDIFSLGTLLWELTTGRKLFSSNSNDLALLQKVEKAEITPPSMVVPNYPSELEEIVLKAMARDREKRFKTALEMRMAIEEFAHTYRVPLTSTRASSYMDSVFPVDKRRVVSMASSMPSLRVSAPLELAAVPTAQLTSGPNKTVVAAHPNESSAPSATPAPPPSSGDELATGVESVDTTDISAINEDDERKKPFPVWIAAVAAAVVFGLGGYALATNGNGRESDDTTQTKAAALSQAPQRAPEAPSRAEPDPPEKAQPEPTLEDTPDAVALVEPEVAEDSDEVEDAPSEQPKATEDAPAAANKRNKTRRKRKPEPSDTPAPAVAESKPVSEPTPATKPKPSATQRKSDGVFLPSRNKKSTDPTTDRHKPSAKDFL